MKKKLLLLTSIGLIGIISLKAQMNVGSSSAPDPSAVLQATSISKGFLPPSMTTLQRGYISNPANGLVIFNTSTNQLEVNSGNTTTPVWLSATNNWSLTGNAATTPGTNFIGTTDANQLVLKANNIISGQLGEINNNTAFGYYTFGGVLGGTGNNNTVFGNRALANSVSTGSGITAIGADALQLNTTGTYHVAIGSYALQNNSTGDCNVAIGYSSMVNNTIGNYNTAVGHLTLGTNTTGGGNVAMGYRTLGIVTTGSNNIGIGAATLNNLTTGNRNIALGTFSGLGILGGTYNTFLGDSTVATGDYSNATAIGALAQVGASNSMVLGSINGVNSATASTNVGIGTTTPAANLDVAGTVKIGTNGTTLNALIKILNVSPISSTVIPANSTAVVSYTVANSMVASAAYVSTASGITLPAGIIIAATQVVTVGTVNVTFANITGSSITITSSNDTVNIG